MDQNPLSLETRFMQHQIKSNTIAKRLLKNSKDETSVIIKYELELIDDDIKFKTKIKLLPIRRIYKSGEKLIDDNDNILHEMKDEDLML